MSAIREYMNADLDLVLEVFQRSVHEVASKDYSPLQIAAWAPNPPDRMAWGSRLVGQGVFVAEMDGRVAGLCKATKEGHIDLLYVHPMFQGVSVASTLLMRVVSWLEGFNVLRLTAHVSITARPFFERHGFTIVKAQQVERGGVVMDNFIMEREL